MCKNCEKLKAEIKDLTDNMKRNYDAYVELREKFRKLAFSYCYETADNMDIV